MKRIKILILIFFFTTVLVFSQKVDSIKVEQSGDFIKIGYQIPNSSPNQIYRVKVLFSVNGLNTEIRSATGDMGDYVVGGKPEYWVVWDVLKDVEELGAAEFIVRAELSNNNLSAEKKSKHLFSVQGALQLPGPGYGLRLGVMGKSGFSVLFLLAEPVVESGSGYTENSKLARFSIDFTTRLSSKNDFQTHLLLGLTMGESVILEHQQWGDDYNVHLTPGPEAGLIFFKKKAVFSIAVSKLLTGMTEEGEAISKTGYLTAGFGIRF